MFKSLKKTVAVPLVLTGLVALSFTGCGRTEVVAMQKQIEDLRTEVARTTQENIKLKEQVTTLNNIVQEMSKLHELQQQKQGLDGGQNNTAAPEKKAKK